MAARDAESSQRDWPAGIPSILQPCETLLTELRRAGIAATNLHPDELIARLAARQDRVVAAKQLYALGIGRGAIVGRVQRRLLTAQFPGVFVLGGTPIEPATRARAALLACPCPALLSHRTTAALRSMREWTDGPIEITIPRGRRVRQAGIEPHERSTLADLDCEIVDGMPMTTAARTLVDLAAVLDERELAAAVERAQVKRLVTKRSVTAAIERAGRLHGIGTLRVIVDTPGFTRSRAERMVRSLMGAAELPMPAFNVRANGYEVDALWREERVILEFDSYAFHASRAAFERDRRRDAAHTRAGHLVLRTTWYELNHRSYALVARIAEALAGRRFAGARRVA